ncbi:hypothetical protein CEP53_003336 [Fusarium sp. AF-6]|nr:hypothetical protein CEP53_003336 [Fusarium sp. AF-6]
MVSRQASALRTLHVALPNLTTSLFRAPSTEGDSQPAESRSSWPSWQPNQELPFPPRHSQTPLPVNFYSTLDLDSIRTLIDPSLPPSLSKPSQPPPPSRPSVFDLRYFLPGHKPRCLA